MSNLCFSRLSKELLSLTTEQFTPIYKIIEITTASNDVSIDDLCWSITFQPLYANRWTNQSLTLDVSFSTKYPFEPPAVKLMQLNCSTHPNIDAFGNVCMDILKLPPNVRVSCSSLILSVGHLETNI